LLWLLEGGHNHGGNEEGEHASHMEEDVNEVMAEDAHDGHDH
jgi:hypothetical protein